MKKLVFAISLLIACCNLQAQVIKGQVIEKPSGLGAIQATITIKGTTTGTATDFDGNYLLPVSQNEGILEFRYVGFQTVEVSFKFEDGQEEIVINVDSDGKGPEISFLGPIGNQKIPLNSSNTTQTLCWYS